MDSIGKLNQWIAKSSSLAFLGGAGVSTESGIPDFRGAQGLYRQGHHYPPEQILSRAFFDARPDLFFDFYRRHLIHLDAQPNAAHHRLADLESQGKLAAVITQNIDGLHQKAGSRHVIELHGSVYDNLCLRCQRHFEITFIQKQATVPHCPECGGLIKPNVVLYGEPLAIDRIEAAIQVLQRSDMLIVGGTSLSVYPAAGLIDYFSGSHLVLINQSPTAYDEQADLVIRQPIGQALAAKNEGKRVEAQADEG